MFKADVIKSFTWNKRHDKLFRLGKEIENLTQEDVDYLKANKVIDNIRPMVESAVIEPKVEKAVKTVKPTKKANKKK